VFQVELCEKIVAKRKAKGLSQKGLADKVKVSFSTVRRWESGNRKPDSDELIKMAYALDTSVSYLIGETDDPFRYVSPLFEGPAESGNPPPTPLFPPPSRTDETVAPKRAVESNVAHFNPSHQLVVRILPKDFAACCGYGVDWQTSSIDFESEMIETDPELTRFSPVIGMYVMGDSMEPDIYDGDMVAFTDNVSDIEYAPNGCTVVVNYEDRMIVRGLFRKGNRVILKAWNKLYDDIVITPEDEFRICGMVLKIYPGPKKPRSML
jgi:SOS-response transcriptional repressor LexA